jgi:hypothetical protein
MVSVFPEREEILICHLGFGSFSLHGGVSSADLEMRQCADGSVEYNSTMVEDFLKLSPAMSAQHEDNSPA